MRLAVLVGGLVAPGTVFAQHAGDMLIGSTTPGGGTLALSYDFTKRVRVYESASGGGNVLFSSTDPGWDLIVSPSGGLFPLASGVAVGVQITAIDPGVSLKIGASTLSAVGQSRALGVAPSIHVHPTWQLVLPAGMQAERRVSFVMTSTAPGHATSAVYTAIVTNTTTTTTTTAPPPSTTTTTTGGGQTTTTTFAATTTTTSTTTSSSSTTTLPAATTSTTRAPSTTTTTTLAVPGDRLTGATLVLRARRGRFRLAVSSRDPAIELGGERGGPADPTVHGAAFYLGSGGGAGTWHALPARNWRAMAKRGVHVGWAYADPRHTAGPVSRVVVRAGRVLELAASGTSLGIDLATDPQPIGVVLRAGEQQWCLGFGGAVRWKARASFIARKAPLPAECAP
jgi:hypothetical protein